jgi:hypothetical protein
MLAKIILALKLSLLLLVPTLIILFGFLILITKWYIILI